MCGLAGWISAEALVPPEPLIRGMIDVIAHRGPDGEGVYRDSGIALGHRRLAIVELSEAGAQPMHWRDRYAIVYNGEIYNHPELRTELEAMGHRFSSHSDTEVILAAYEAWGGECLHKFNGMWAFLLWDRQERTLFAARDRFGVKPLYYRMGSDGSLAFASEIKQFTVLPGWRARLNHQRAYDFLNWGVIDHTDETLFDGVFQLRGGQCLLLKPQDLAGLQAGERLAGLRTWYRLPEDTQSGDYGVAVAEFRRLLDDAVRLRLRADVDVGSCLSGGLDSSSIVGLMNRQLRASGAETLQNTFSACAHEKRFDERPHMEAVIRQTGVQAHFVYPRHEDLFETLDRLVWHQDEPFGSTSIFAQWKVFELAAENRVKVMLDGQGADEQLAGYMVFFGPLFAGLFRRGRWLTLLQEIRAAKRIHGMTPLLAAKHIVNMLAPDWLRDRLRQRVGHVVLRPDWLDTERLNAEPGDPFADLGAKTATVNGLCRAQLTATNLQMLLHWEDRDSMAHSIEARVPFLDYRLAEFLIRLPDDWKLRDGVTKRILRDAMKEVIPETVRQRMDKLGFVTPEEVWLRQDSPEVFRRMLRQAIADSRGILRPQAEQVLERMISGEAGFSFLPWRMICFGTWMRCFNVEP